MELLELLEHITDNVRNDRPVMGGLIYTTTYGERLHPTLVPDAPYWIQLNGILWADHPQYSVKPRTHMVNGYEVPAPLTEMPEVGSKIFLKDAYHRLWHKSIFIRPQDDNNYRYLKRRLMFETKEGAVQNAKAEAGTDPFNDEGED